MRRLRKIFLMLVGLGVVACGLAAHYYYKGFYKWSHGAKPSFDASGVRKLEVERISGKAEELRAFLTGGAAGRPGGVGSRTGEAGGRYSQRVAFLVDMRVPSGRHRFFVYDLAGDSIRMAGLVAHGNGSERFSITPTFSNTEGSHCSALGRYRVGAAYAGQFGRAYVLHGLDSTNSRALQRHVVLHSYTCVPDGETDPYPICNSQGCPMVSPGFMARLQPVIDGEKKPVVLWIFN